MKTPKTILVPTDFSERAHNALGQAVYLADKINAKLVIYHVYHRPAVEKRHTLALAELEKNIDDNFKDLLNSIPKLKNISHEFIRELGLSVEKIAGKLNQNEVDMLVMATKGAKGFNEIWGTKTAKIIKLVDKPVFVIPDNTGLKDLKKLALACDYSSKANEDAITFLTDLAQELKFAIDVVTLNREEKTMIRSEISNRNQLIEQMRSVKASFKFTQHPHIDKGIIEYAMTNNINAVVVLSKSYSFIESLFHESLTEKMVFNSPIPLIVI